MAAKTTRKKEANEMVKQELLNSVKENDDLEEPCLDVTADSIKGLLVAVRIVKRYEETIRFRNKER